MMSTPAIPQRLLVFTLTLKSAVLVVSAVEAAVSYTHLTLPTT